MRNPWKTVSSKVVYRNQWITVQEDIVKTPRKKQGIYAFVKRCASVIIVPTTETGNVYFIKQWRYPLGKETIEFPWGGVDGKETLLHAAKRELREETGLIAKRWIELGTIDILGSYGDEVAHIYLAITDKRVTHMPDSTEKIITVSVPLKKALLWCTNGTISNSGSIAAIYRAEKYLNMAKV